MDASVAGPVAGADREPRGDRVALLALAVGGLLLYGPLFHGWIRGALLEDRHELLIVAVSAWLIWRRAGALAALPLPAKPVAAWGLFGLSLVGALLGGLVDSVLTSTVAFALTLASLLWLLRGGAAVRICAFPLAFLLFAVPLPAEFVLWLTGPLKEAVSAVATWLLALAGYPAGHSGVVMTVGQYQLLVVEACAGLQTMLTLEAMGLLYISLRDQGSAGRAATLAALVVPISFTANVVRVVCLALITYHFGDAAGQGFLHGFAGIVLFLVALLLIFAVDTVLARLWRRGGGRA